MRILKWLSEVCIGSITVLLNTKQKYKLSILRKKYLTNSCITILRNKLVNHSDNKKSPTTYGTRRVITLPKAASQWPLPWATSNQSTTFTHPAARTSISILSYSYHSPNSQISFSFAEKMLFVFSMSPTGATYFTFHTLFIKYLTLNFQISLSFSDVIILWRFQSILYACFLVSIYMPRPICPSYLFTIIMSGDAWNLLSCSLPNFLQLSMGSRFLSVYGQN